MSYRPDRRDPLVQRFARSIAETMDDPWACSEGPTEPQRVVLEHDTASAGHAAVPWVSGIGLVAVVSALLMGWL